MARCVNKDLIFYGSVICEEDDEAQVRDVLSLMKWIGTMRNRGFGHIRVDVK
jgi:CRISPR-associated protein Csx10